MKKDERLITISYIAGEGWLCGVEGCENEADYMAEGRIYCTFHWVRSNDLNPHVDGTVTEFE